MRQISHTTMLVFGFFALTLSACFTAAPAPTIDLNTAFTQVAATLTSVALTGTNTPTASETPPATNTPWIITATFTNTPPFTDTPTSTATYTITNTSSVTNTPSVTNTASSTNTPTRTATPTVTNTPKDLCNQAQLQRHVTIPPGTFMALDKPFTKIWRVLNIGTCAWTNKYKIVFSSGDNLATKAVYDLPQRVDPGESVDIAIDMRSPNKNGTFTGNWLLRTDTGKTFGLAATGNGPLQVRLQVSAQVNSSFVYDFAANACTASWVSGAGPRSCPGSESGSAGFVIPTLNPLLETRQEDEPGLWMRPNQSAGGYIRGVFPLFQVSSGDHFVAALGCHGESSKCNVRFTLSYLTQNGTEHVLDSWDEEFDGQLTPVDIDLSSLDGMRVRFVLIVESNTNVFEQADGIWFLPSIRR